ncbi:FtsB family cell division protein [Brevibacillus dissolubilis]|uniref:FtsB family cell division protein n=1 Tax=Brevibacillus dissolubilis TaxID=1844116 RepID=UPI0011172D84|nr:septum formation initiator family protein [Brevibacillus dissolubilis]
MNTSPTQSQSQGRKRRIRLTMFFVLCFLVWTGYTTYLQSGILTEKEEKLAALQAQADEVQDKNKELNYKANRLNDKEYIAELARKNHFMAKPGEVLFVLPD